MALIESNDKNFKEMINCEYAVVDCYGDHCGPCKMLAPIFQQAASEMDFIRFIKFNTEHNPEITAEYELYSLPTLMFFINGELVNKTIGFRHIKQIRELIAKMLYE